ncbi:MULTISPECIES: acyl-CoA dehydrogenase family protein [Streptomyces]|uniref:Acyl-CoA dehydrogenase n=1 Tax=Streptomyces spororaveus TaxID=284039 RepID=A0ABQ3THK0_9ACTN|nr:acyl-CoA dehydrogenase family protein [Streptomyces spororaveus]MCM9080194.1 acyl-CoA/acyl-ACP dehydrogenase [Streptomyces spororaveus]GHI79487.1 acyl-CoA dehydrogenase [Streptomyces spororaveus]
MDFQPTEDQKDLRAGVRDLLAGRYGREALRASLDTGTAVDRGLWRELGAAGFFALRLPESEGGVGLGLPEAVLVFEEAGRALVPGPLVATHLAAGVVPGAAAGTAVVSAFDLGGRLVAHLGEADAVLGASAVPAGEPVRSVDPLTPLHRVASYGGGGDGNGRSVGDCSAFREAGALLTAALQLGSALRTVELAVRYAGEREQFGQPIGAFQAVKHLCAGMLVRAEVARTAVYAAAVTQDPGEVAAAKLLADGAAVGNARDCLQVHGGMGFTWEADVHLHLKRAWVRSEQWRTAGEAEELLAQELLGSAG